jgi:hypothetical protein
MSATLAEFKIAFPEFALIGDTLIQSRLTMAGTWVSSVMFADMYDYAVMLKAADLLAASPLGEQARMTIKGGRSTIYGEQFEALKRASTGGYRVIM